MSIERLMVWKCAAGHVLHHVNLAMLNKTTPHPVLVLGSVVHEAQHLVRDLLRISIHQRGIGVRQERHNVRRPQVHRQAARNQACNASYHHSSATEVWWPVDPDSDTLQTCQAAESTSGLLVKQSN